ALEEVRDPADAGLDDDEPEPRVTLADAAEDELGDELADAHRGERDERLAHAGRRVEEALELHAARSLDVERERNAGLLDCAPERLPRWIAVVRGADVVREGVDLRGARALRGDATQLRDRLVDRAVDGEDRDR